MMELYQVSPGNLDGWIADHLQPSKEFRENIQEAVKRICDCLKEKTDMSVIKAIKAGSTGKGTTLGDNSDADLVVFLCCFSSYQDQKEKRESVIKNIEEHLNRHSQSIAYNIDILPPKSKAKPPRALSLTIQYKKKKEAVEMDILPAYDALGQITRGPEYQPDPKVYEDLIQARGEPGDFNTCFTELQRDFVKCCPAKVKSLLRLVKHWYKEFKANIRRENPSARLPPKYALELLTIYAWEEGTSEAEDFKTAEGFCTVMKLLTEYQFICLYWTRYYSLENHIIGPYMKRKLRSQCPVIIDPADPTGNVGKGKGWDVLAKEARNCMNQPCCKKGSEPLSTWNVQPARAIRVTLRLEMGTDFTMLPRWNPYNTILQIKKKIEEKKDISAHEQTLTLQRPEQEPIALQNQKSLADYGVFYNITLLLDVKEIEIIVVDLQGKSRIFRILPTEKVLGLKRKIEERLRIPVDQQQLMYNSTELDDTETLASYQIRSKDTVYLVARLRGGNTFFN